MSQQRFFETEDVEERKSKWMNRHYITVVTKPEDMMPYKVFHGMDRICSGIDEHAALLTASKLLGIKSWLIEA